MVEIGEAKPGLQRVHVGRGQAVGVPVAFGQRQQGGWLDRAFQVDVQLCLGHALDERGRFWADGQGR